MEQTVTNSQVSTQSKRPKIITILIIVLVWLFVRTLFDLLRYQTVSDYNILNNFGFGVLYIVFALAVLIVTGSAAVFVFKQYPRAFPIAVAGIVLYLFFTVVMFVISFTHVDLAKDAYIISREARGLAVRQEALDFTFSPVGMAVNFGIYFLVFIVLLIGLFKNKKYFNPNNTITSTEN
ncbi:MAG: hypothetical protein WC659_03700 [Patescibacteria group bacterium]